MCIPGLSGYKNVSFFSDGTDENAIWENMREYIFRYDIRIVILKLEYASESPGRLLKTQTAGLTLGVSHSESLEWGW